jgi:hypothetical protein
LPVAKTSVQHLAVTNRPCTTTGKKCAALVSDQEEFVAMLSERDKERVRDTET